MSDRPDNSVPKRRWFRYGEPWGLLAKTNPNATTRSVVWHGIIWAPVGAILVGGGAYFKGWTIEHCLIIGLIMGILAGLVGALAEWQLDDSDPDEEPRDEAR